MEQNDTIQQYLDSINNSIEELRQNKKEIKDDDLPSNFKLMMNGANNSKVLNFIFDTRLDVVIDKVLDNLLNGNLDAIDKYLESISKIFETLGLGKGAFSGPVSQLLMNNIMSSLNSINFVSTDNKIKKIIHVLNNLKKQSKDINNKELRKKYNESLYAFKKVLKFIAKVYKNRRIITNRVRQGLHYAVNENYDALEELETFEV